jgi:hypothetical protein
MLSNGLQDNKPLNHLQWICMPRNVHALPLFVKLVPAAIRLLETFAAFSGMGPLEVGRPTPGRTINSPRFLISESMRRTTTVRRWCSRTFSFPSPYVMLRLTAAMVFLFARRRHGLNRFFRLFLRQAQFVERLKVEPELRPSAEEMPEAQARCRRR